MFLIFISEKTCSENFFILSQKKSSYISLKKVFLIFYQINLSSLNNKKFQERTFRARKIKKNLIRFLILWNFKSQDLKIFKILGDVELFSSINFIYFGIRNFLAPRLNIFLCFPKWNFLAIRLENLLYFIKELAKPEKQTK